MAEFTRARSRCSGPSRAKVSRRSVAAALEALARAGDQQLQVVARVGVERGAGPRPGRCPARCWPTGCGSPSLAAACRCRGRPRGTCPSGRSWCAAARWRPRGSSPCTCGSSCISTTALPSFELDLADLADLDAGRAHGLALARLHRLGVGQLDLDRERLVLDRAGSAAAGWSGCSRRCPAASDEQRQDGEEVAEVVLASPSSLRPHLAASPPARRFLAAPALAPGARRPRRRDSWSLGGLERARSCALRRLRRRPPAKAATAPPGAFRFGRLLGLAGHVRPARRAAGPPSSGGAGLHAGARVGARRWRGSRAVAVGEAALAGEAHEAAVGLLERTFWPVLRRLVGVRDRACWTKGTSTSLVHADSARAWPGSGIERAVEPHEAAGCWRRSSARGALQLRGRAPARAPGG